MNAPGRGHPVAGPPGEATANGKPTAAELEVDLAAQTWRRSGDHDDAIEVAIVRDASGEDREWVLLRVAGDPAERVLIYDRNEWECFLDGVRGGEFDDALP